MVAVTEDLSISTEDLPALYQAARAAASRAQRRYLILSGINLLLLVATAAVSVFPVAVV